MVQGLVSFANVSDISEHRLGVAKKMGVDYIVHVDSRDSQALAEKIKSTLGCEADITIECSGAESSIQTGIYVGLFLLFEKQVTTTQWRLASKKTKDVRQKALKKEYVLYSEIELKRTNDMNIWEKIS